MSGGPPMMSERRYAMSSAFVGVPDFLKPLDPRTSGWGVIFGGTLG
jgi:hypothetical protein